jgi:hypothetical protein
MVISEGGNLSYGIWGEEVVSLDCGVMNHGNLDEIPDCLAVSEIPLELNFRLVMKLTSIGIFVSISRRGERVIDHWQDGLVKWPS